MFTAIIYNIYKVCGIDMQRFLYINEIFLKLCTCKFIFINDWLLLQECCLNRNRDFSNNTRVDHENSNISFQVVPHCRRNTSNRNCTFHPHLLNWKKIFFFIDLSRNKLLHRLLKYMKGSPT